MKNHQLFPPSIASRQWHLIPNYDNYKLQDKILCDACTQKLKLFEVELWPSLWIPVERGYLANCHRVQHFHILPPQTVSLYLTACTRSVGGLLHPANACSRVECSILAAVINRPTAPLIWYSYLARTLYADCFPLAYKPCSVVSLLFDAVRIYIDRDCILPAFCIVCSVHRYQKWLPIVLSLRPIQAYLGRPRALNGADQPWPGSCPHQILKWWWGRVYYYVTLIA